MPKNQWLADAGTTVAAQAGGGILGKIRVVTSKTDKYGRWLADIYVTDSDGVEFNVNKRLIEGGFAVPYMTG